MVVSRLVITGGNHHRLHEELIQSAGYISDTSFRREARVGEVRRWMDEAEPCTINEHTMIALATRFDRHVESIKAAVSSRANERLKTLGNTLRIQCEKETKDISDVLGELEKTIRQELTAEKQPEQLGFSFDDLNESERTQLKRDTQALEARLARIPEERQNEIKAIETRFNEPSEHAFPVAMIVIVPQSLAEQSE
jgi:polyhydroxyalkanoate synthesis regulator phasin